ncbi:hypothetical protein M9H77_06596 [Catharanthus roseus]|uniref:Uncharacterized protein n=1 Tax=Catharanthus roseus TaxID=4058 RepID=A0ACC0BSJ0_CATRO|nr:hypothetical protein M9H77_06596 [Catharanthus roseus]
MNMQEVIDENDEKLTSLKKEFGDDDEVYKAVIRASNELNEYNPSGRYPVPELWNPLEGRKASLKEGVSHILKLWKLNKRKRDATHIFSDSIDEFIHDWEDT